MLPFMAQGHIIPFLSLAKHIQQSTNFSITIATAPLNIKSLQSTISSASSNHNDIHLAELPFGSSDHDLPPNTETTENVPRSKMISLLAASLSLEPPARRLITNIIKREGRPPLCLISDVFFGWATDLANSLGTVNVNFNTSGAYGIAAYTSVWLNLPHRSASNEYFTIPGFPEHCRFYISQLSSFVRAADGTDSWSRFFQSQISLSTKSFGWLCNTWRKLSRWDWIS
ncbi:hypothetical protein ACFX2C_031769 [Malus domestica]